jgi:hypothetical protein
MLGAEVRGRATAMRIGRWGWGPAPEPNRMPAHRMTGLPPGRPRPRARRPCRADPIPSRQPRAGGGSGPSGWLVHAFLAARAGSGGRRAPAPSAPTQGIFLSPAAVGGLLGSALSASGSGPRGLGGARGADRRAGSSNRPSTRVGSSCAAAAACLACAAPSGGYVSARGWVLRPSDVTACPLRSLSPRHLLFFSFF